MATLLIVAGGSGGHIVPGLAIAEEWEKSFPDDKIYFVTSGRAVERFFKAELDRYQLVELTVPAFNELKKNPWRFFGEFWRSYKTAGKIIELAQPDAVIGMGAMTSVPVILSAWRKKLPIFLHEQNKVAGRATKHLARFANNIFTSFPETIGLCSDRKSIYTGNSVRPQINSAHPSLSQNMLLVLGGSQGATHLNHAISELVNKHPEILTQFKLVHQVGSDYKRVLQNRKLDICWEQYEFLQPISEFYAQAKVVICRSGAGTLAELAAWGIPSILIPYPQAVQQHQLANAREYVTQQASLLVEEAETPSQTADLLWSQLQLISQPVTYLNMKSALIKLARPDAAGKICCEVAKVIHP